MPLLSPYLGNLFIKQSGPATDYETRSDLGRQAGEDPRGSPGGTCCAHIELSPEGTFLYASNRGEDTISVFSIEEDGAALELVECVSTQGLTPRFFTVVDMPDGGPRFMYVLNQDSDEVVTLLVDRDRGTLTSTGIRTPCPSPACLVTVLLGRHANM